MIRFLSLGVACLILWPAASRGAAVGYTITITTAYASGDPFTNRLDNAFTEPNTGYVEVENTGAIWFSGVIATIANSAFTGDLSFASDPLVLAPGQAVSIAIPDNSANVGGFNGPAYFQRSGVDISLDGTISNGLATETVDLLVADANIHSGVTRTDQYGLSSDSCVLQGGDPWGFDTGAAYGLSQADGVYVFEQAVPEPGSLLLAAAASLIVVQRGARLRQSGIRRGDH